MIDVAHPLEWPLAPAVTQAERLTKVQSRDTIRKMQSRPHSAEKRDDQFIYSRHRWLSNRRSGASGARDHNRFYRDQKKGSEPFSSPQGLIKMSC